MDSIFLQIVLQIPTIALLVFAGLLFRGFQRERVNLEDSRMLLESKFADVRTADTDGTVKRLDESFRNLSADLEALRARLDEFSADQDRAKEYMDNQKTALKEFGRVLSRTSEQTYSDLQQLDDRIASMRRALADQGFELPAAAA